MKEINAEPEKRSIRLINILACNGITMQKLTILLIFMVLSGCKTTIENRSTGVLHYVNVKYIKAHGINLDTESEHIANCHMEGSKVKGEIIPIQSIPAAKRGMTGVVKMAFSILPNGALGDFVLLEANPKRIFDRQARRTLNEIKCEPAMINGKAAKLVNQVITLNFDLVIKS